MKYLFILFFVLYPQALWAWDSATPLNIFHATHSDFTEAAIVALQSRYPELAQFRSDLIAGSNTELHELPVSGEQYGLDLNSKRLQHKGSNEGCLDIQGWWQDARLAYLKGQYSKAYFLLGVMLHMIQDMGVPAHAHYQEHQGNLWQLDAFEAVALTHWQPHIIRNQPRPSLASPWQYYAYSAAWARFDAPKYRSSAFSLSWWTASRAERDLIQQRQAATILTTQWALETAMLKWRHRPL